MKFRIQEYEEKCEKIDLPYETTGRINVRFGQGGNFCKWEIKSPNPKRRIDWQQTEDYRDNSRGSRRKENPQKGKPSSQKDIKNETPKVPASTKILGRPFISKEFETKSVEDLEMRNAEQNIPIEKSSELTTVQPISNIDKSRL